MLNMVCTICTCGFAITATALSLYNGEPERGSGTAWCSCLISRIPLP